MPRKRHHMLTSMEKDKVVKLFQEGVKPRYIAERFNVSVHTVHNMLRKRGI